MVFADGPSHREDPLDTPQLLGVRHSGEAKRRRIGCPSEGGNGLLDEPRK